MSIANARVKTDEDEGKLTETGRKPSRGIDTGGNRTAGVEFEVVVEGGGGESIGVDLCCCSAPPPPPIEEGAEGATACILLFTVVELFP